jgi:hypothetical protein
MKAKDEFLRPHAGVKKGLKEKVEKLKADIAGFSGHKPGQGFDWAVEFAEVFIKGGFDAVLANPPYVRQELITEIKPPLKRVFPDTYSGTADLYCYFYVRGTQLLTNNGMLAFISSNKWLRSGYGKKLREHLASQCQIMSLTDFGELPVFETAATFPMIFVAQKHEPSTGHQFAFTQVKNLDTPYPDIASVISAYGSALSSDAISSSSWRLVNADKATLLRKMEEAGVPLTAYVEGNIFYGIKTGLNEAFVIDDATRNRLVAEDAKSEEIIHRTAKGDDVRRWRIEAKNQWLIVTKIGIDMKRYPAVFAHLKQWKSKLEKRSDQGDHWWELRSCRYYEVFESPKIVFPDFAMESRFTLDRAGYFVDTTSFVIPGSDLFLLGVLNSKWVWRFLSETAAVLGDPTQGGRLRLKKIYVETIPIPKASSKEKTEIEKLVKRCIELKGQNCNAPEHLIDECVAKLYGVES